MPDYCVDRPIGEWPPGYRRRLRDTLAKAYDRPDEARAVVEELTVPAAHGGWHHSVPWTTDLNTIWNRVIREASRRNLLRGLLLYVAADPQCAMYHGEFRLLLRTRVDQVEYDPERCGARTLKHSQCRRRPRKGSSYCWQHDPSQD